MREIQAWGEEERRGGQFSFPFCPCFPVPQSCAYRHVSRVIIGVRIRSCNGVFTPLPQRDANKLI